MCGEYKTQAERMLILVVEVWFGVFVYVVSIGDKH
jgi:hypothetical protein